jgi:UDP-glucose 4-epimerase
LINAGIVSQPTALLEKLLNRPVERQYLLARPIDVPVNVLCNDLARRELGWTPQISLFAGLEKTAIWMRKALGL